VNLQLLDDVRGGRRRRYDGGAAFNSSDLESEMNASAAWTGYERHNNGMSQL